jgi:predicted DsbA family dithiol-disulfide isomerase
MCGVGQAGAVPHLVRSVRKAGQTEAMNIEIWSDVVCPWCYIGKRRFESALAQFAHREQVSVVWRSYQLDPNAPRIGEQTVTDMLAQKLGVSRTQAAAMNARVTAIAADEGLDYQLEQAQYSNTFDAHRVLHLAATHQRQAELKERLLHAHFTEGASLGETETLVRLASEVGIDGDEARATLGSDAYADEVRSDIHRAAQLGIRGVPFFVIDDTYGISGAQPTAKFSTALEQAWAESHPLQMIGDSTDESDACEGESCRVPPIQ